MREGGVLKKTRIETLLDQLERDAKAMCEMYESDELSHYMSCTGREKAKHIYHRLARTPHNIRTLRSLVCKNS